MSDRYLTTQQVVLITQRHEKTIQAAARKYKASRGRKGLRSFRAGRRGEYRYLESDVHSWMQGKS